MKPAAVIDTNVLLVANGSHEAVSDACREACIVRLESIKQAGVVVIDDGYRIIREYLNKTTPRQPQGQGDAFLKWLLNNVATEQHVCSVTINELAPDEFAEFPDSALQSRFDPPDRKFAAVANAHPDKPPIWQAADSKWLDWWGDLDAKGIKVDFLCPHDAMKFYKKKFPTRTPPVLPPTP